MIARECAIYLNINIMWLKERRLRKWNRERGRERIVLVCHFKLVSSARIDFVGAKE